MTGTPWWTTLGCQHQPFTRNLPVERLFPTPSWHECRARVLSVLDEHGFMVLTGESGAGKSTALRAVLQTLHPSQFVHVYLAAAQGWTPRLFYRALAPAIDVPVAPWADDTERQVRQTLWNLATQQGRLPVVTIDEAHFSSPHVLQELRLLLNFAMDTVAPLALILAGHTELRRKLRLRPLDAVRQRVTLAYQLPALTAAETAADTTHHWRQDGVERPVFTDAALNAAHDWSPGIPRRINHWARAGLMAAVTGGQTLVDDGIVGVAEAERQWAGPV
ncbi:MAG: AAA family ATPase [Thermaerobacter sp.]|nr:AAA family ATPase [Thermaerobacter sp.]